MRKYFFFALAACIMAACTPKNEYRIHGYVTNAELNGVQVFLVPLHDQSPKMVDSVYVKDNHFEFKGHGKLRQEWMADIRVDKMHRLGVESLLVITEPGDIYVTIGKTSSSYGTPQNDSLQVWKEQTVLTNNRTSALRRIGKTAEADSVYIDYANRSHDMGEAMGTESTLGKFLLERYPSKR